MFQWKHNLKLTWKWKMEKVQLWDRQKAKKLLLNLWFKIDFFPTTNFFAILAASPG